MGIVGVLSRLTKRHRSPRIKKYLVLGLLTLILTLIPWVYFKSLSPSVVKAGWWNDHFQYRQRLPISNGSGETKTDFQFKLELDTQTLITDGQMQSSCSDIRFTDHSGKELHYFLEPNTCNTTTTILFVKIPTIPTTGTNIFLYYGNSQASSKSSTSNVFIRELDSSIANWPLDDTDPTQSYARVINQGAELGRDIVINGGFDSDTVWSKGAGWTIADGVASSDGTGTYSNLNQPLPLISGKAYQVTFTISNYVSGGIRPWVGLTGTGTTRSTNGTFTEIVVSTGTANLYLQTTTTFVGDIENVSVRQVDIPSSDSIDSTQELVIDGDMEAADTSAWIASMTGTVLTKETSNPYEGSHVLRVTTAVAWGRAEQSILTRGKSYRVLGYMRGDGVVGLPAITTSSWGISGGVGSSSSSWQKIDLIFNAAQPLLSFNNTQSSGYTEFDSFSITEVSPMVGRNTNGVTVGVAANGHLERAYSFDGTNDVVNIYSSDLNSSFNPDEGTLVAWAKVANAGVWSDGITRNMVVLRSNDQNLITIQKSGSQINAAYIANGTQSNNHNSGNNTTTTEWFKVGITWSKQGDEAKIYYNGSQAGATLTGLGDWVGNLSTTNVTVGSGSTTGTGPWSGLINDVRLYDRALSPEEIADMYSDETDIQVYATDNYPGKELIRQFDSDITIGSPATAELAPGPIAHWSFDSLEGSTVRDVSGNGNNGTNNGATLLTEDQCISGKCMRFDGVDDRVSAGQNIVFTDGVLTVGTWIRPQSISSNQVFIGQEQNTGPFGWSIRIDGNQQLSFVVRDSNWARTTTLPKVNEWSYVVGTYDGSTIKLYLNGQELASTNYTGTVYQPALDLYVGGTPGFTRFFNGTIDEVKIYPYARSAEEIRMDYLAGAASAGSGAVLGVGDQSFLSDGLVGYWKMDEASWNGTVGEVIDASGNGNHGTATGAVTGAGKYGSGGSFDGVDDLLSNFSVNAGRDSSLAIWIKLDGANNGAYLFQGTDGYQRIGTFNSTNRIGFYSGGLSQGYVYGQTNMNDGNWHHVVFVDQQEPRSRKIYVNGETDLDWTILNHANDFYKGDGILSGIGGGYGQFKGSIDETRIYNRALSPAEVRALYEYAPGPVVHIKMDENVGTTAYDSSGNSINASFYNSPSWQSGRFGGGVFIDEGSNKSLVFDSNPLANMSAFTVSMWVNRNHDSIGALFGTLGGGPYWRSTNGTSFILHLRSSDCDNQSVWGVVSALETGWQYYTLSINADGTLYYYRNGDQISSANYIDQFGEPWDKTCATVSHWRQIGNYSTASGIGGIVDDFKIYNYARTAEQIKEDMMAGRPLDHESVDDPTPTKQSISFSTGNERDDVIDGPGADPIAYWDFNERSGTTLTDKSGNGNHGTLVNGPEWVSGKYGAGLAFNIDGKRVSVPHSETLAPEVFSASLWVNTTSPQSCNEGFQQLLRKGNWMFYRYDDGNSCQLNWRVVADSTLSIGTGIPLEPKKWHHVVIIYENVSSGMKLYVNGKLIGSRNGNGAFISGTGELNIGGISGNSAFKGIIDEVKIFDYALTPAQVAYEYNRGAPIAHWMMDECQGSVIHDASGNENHGTLTIGPSGTQTSVGTCDTVGSAWGNGKVGRLNSSMSFDGTDDYVDLGIGFGHFQQTDPFTISSWIKTSDSNGAILSKWNVPNQPGWRQDLNSGYVRLILTSANGGAGRAVRTNRTFNDSTWHHVVTTYDGSSSAVGINIFIDGKLEQTTLVLDTNPGVLSDVAIRIANQVGTDNLLSGQIDDVKIFNYALSADQVKTLYNNGAVSFR